MCYARILAPNRCNLLNIFAKAYIKNYRKWFFSVFISDIFVDFLLGLFVFSNVISELEYFKSQCTLKIIVPDFFWKWYSIFQAMIVTVKCIHTDLQHKVLNLWMEMVLCFEMPRSVFHRLVPGKKKKLIITITALFFFKLINLFVYFWFFVF